MTSTTTESQSLMQLIQHKHVLICCGSGGVGKTTLSAALACAAAAEGRRVLVMTIDPARRLAQAMGLDNVGNEPTQVSASFDGKALDLSAIMLDSADTFDSIIDRYAPNEKARAQIKESALYRRLSATLAGSKEFMAMEKLHQVESDFDLVVVDTPPSQHALDFLDAPQRMVELVENPFVEFLRRSENLRNRWTLNPFKGATQQMMSLVERFTGNGALLEISRFFNEFGDAIDHFKGRAQRVDELIHAQDTAYLAVAGPQAASLQQVQAFQERLVQHKHSLQRVLVNRVLPSWPESSQWPASFDDELRNACEVVTHRLAGFAQREALAIQSGWGIDDVPVQTIPRFASGIESMEGLQRLAQVLLRE